MQNNQVVSLKTDLKTMRDILKYVRETSELLELKYGTGRPVQLLEFKKELPYWFYELRDLLES